VSAVDPQPGRYDEIGRTYALTRREDPRVAATIHDCLGHAGTVVNVGAGTGNYEPRDRTVVAVEPSQTMIDQRPGRSPLVVRGVAEHLPFPDGAFDAAMAVLTVHHWTDPDSGLAELRRVARRQVIFLFEPLVTHDFWALRYFPAALDLPTEQDPPNVGLFRRHLDVREVRPVPVPHDCTDGFGAAFWARPEAYLDPTVQAGMSWMAMLPSEDLEAGTEWLRAELASGEWDQRYGHLRQWDAFDAGYRIAVAGS
jgi:SAM-dependent methyltransferase